MEELTDLIGKRFGRWTVVCRSENSKDGKTKWLCRCDCGKEKAVYGRYLRSGQSLSCGCIRNEMLKQSRIVDLTGRRFGSLKVISYADNSKWLCKCDCGNEKVVDSYNLTSGHTKSCGCFRSDAGKLRVKNLIGQSFGRLTVIAQSGRDTQNKIMWKCICVCGNEKIVRGNDLKSGAVQSCGCFKKERFTEMRKLITPYKTHGLSNTRLYRVWGGMLQLCYNPNNSNYHNYGGRGITVCDEWRNDFQAFYDWAIANGYKEEGLPNGKNKWTIDRIDFNGNYEPSNCRWVDMLVQSNNKRDNHLVTYRGETLTLAETARKYNISSKVLGGRLADGWGVEEAIETPLNPKKHTQRKDIAEDKRRKKNRTL